MTKYCGLKLVKFDSRLFDGEYANSRNLTEFLTQIINNGYDIPKEKYKIVKTTRVKNADVFVEDLELSKPGSFLWTLINYSADTVIDLKDTSAIEKSLEDLVADKDFRFDGIELNQVLGTIGGKPVHDETGKGLEVTGFTSFSPGAGKLLLELLEDFSRQALRLDFVYASAIVEHEMVSYYTRLGYKEFKRKLVKVDSNGKVLDPSFEDGVIATRDFHTAGLKKQLH